MFKKHPVQLKTVTCFQNMFFSKRAPKQKAGVWTSPGSATAVLRSQPAGDVSHKPGGRLPLLSAWPAVTLAALKTAATNFAA